MCRLYGFRANEPTKVECSLVYAQNALMLQSKADLRGKSHSDGWGIGIYENGEPVIERRETAAHQGLHFSVTAERVYAETVLAHVRRATVGGPLLANTHPFSYPPWMFAHNGTVTGFDVVEPRLKQECDPDLLELRRGTTDSELAFYWLLSRMRAAGLDLKRRCRDPERLIEVVRQSIARLALLCDKATSDSAKLNWLLTDGMLLIATRWNNSLHCVHRAGVHDCEICGIPHIHHVPGADYRAVVVASEPISHERWDEVPNRSVLVVDDRIYHRLQAI